MNEGKKCNCEEGFDGKYCQNNKEQTVCQALEPCVLLEISQDLGLDPEQKSVFMEKCKENRKHKAGIIFGKSIVNVCIKEEGQFSNVYFV